MVSPEWLMSTRISNTMPSQQHNKNISICCSSPTKPSTLSLGISGPSHRYPQMVLFQWADALRTLRNQKLRQRPSTKIFQLLLVSNCLINTSQAHLTCLFFCSLRSTSSTASVSRRSCHLLPKSRHIRSAFACSTTTTASNVRYACNGSVLTTASTSIFAKIHCRQWYCSARNTSHFYKFHAIRHR